MIQFKIKYKINIIGNQKEKILLYGNIKIKIIQNPKIAKKKEEKNKKLIYSENIMKVDNINNELQKSNNANNDNLPIVNDLIQNNNMNKKEVDESNKN